MLPLLAKDRFFWTLRLSGRPLEEPRHRARWKVARIQSPVSVRYQHALKTLRPLSPKRRGQLAPTHAFARHLAIGVAIDIYGRCRGRQITHQYWHFLTASSRSPRGRTLVMPVLGGVHDQYFRGRQSAARS